MLWLRQNEGLCFVGRTERQRVPAINGLFSKPKLDSLGPAYIRRTICGRAAVATGRVRSL